MFHTHPESLKNLLDDAGSGKIQLPDFQRGWVWDDDRIRGLLASISRGFPVGAIMTLQAGGDIRLKSRLIEGVDSGPAHPPDEYLLDGQQRLTSLYQALRHEGPVDTKDNRNRRIKRWYYVDMLKAMDPNVDREEAIISVPENRKETRNFGREIVLNLSSRELEYQQHMMPTERLLDSMDWLFGYNDYWQTRNGQHPSGNLIEFRNGFNQSVLSAFTGYDLPVISLDKETPKEAVCTVFEKVNTGGVTLSVFELVTATFAAQDENFSLREDWTARSDRLYGGYGALQGIGGVQFLQTIALLTTQERRKQAIAEGHLQNRIPAINCRKGDILGLDVADYHKWADEVEAGFVAAAKFLHSQFVFTQRDVPYTTQLVPLAAIYVELGTELEPANAKALLERWFWSGIFGEMYGGAVETQYGLDLAQVAEWIRGGPDPTLISEANFIPERLLSLRTRQSAAYKGVYALQMKSGASDWRTDSQLTFSTWHDENIDIHHIFPHQWCEDGKDHPKVPQRLYNSIINKTPIDAKTNKIIGGSAPSAYLPRLERDNEQLSHVLVSHWITPERLRNDEFAECFIERGEAMLELISHVMGKSIPGGREVFQNAVSSAGLAQETDDYEDVEDEPDAVGERTYDDNVAQVAD
jgi:hypothetical protein